MQQMKVFNFLGCDMTYNCYYRLENKISMSQNICRPVLESSRKSCEEGVYRKSIGKGFS